MFYYLCFDHYLLGFKCSFELVKVVFTINFDIIQVSSWERCGLMWSPEHSSRKSSVWQECSAKNSNILEAVFQRMLTTNDLAGVGAVDVCVESMLK